MIAKNKTPQPIKPKSLTQLKDDGISPKGKDKRDVEPDWPTKESTPLVKKRKIKRTETARLP